MRETNIQSIEKRVFELEKNGGSGGSSAEKVSYDNSISGLTADNVQNAIDEVHEEVENIRHHYSTEEKIVGEWVDGSIIYEKVIILTPTQSSYDYLVDDTVNYKKLIDSRIISDRFNGVVQGMISSSVEDRLLLHLTNNKLCAAIGSNYVNTVITCIAQYIKNE